MPLILLLGDIAIDLSYQVRSLPEEGGEAFASGQRTGLGGSATNTAVALAALGERPQLIARLGNDPWGDVALAELARLGVATGAIVRDPAAPTQVVTVIVAASGERTMVTCRGANAYLTPDEVTARFPADIGILHLSGYAFVAAPQCDAARHAAALARARGVRVTLDIPAGVGPLARERLQALFPDIDTLMLGPADAIALASAQGTQGTAGDGSAEAGAPKGGSAALSAVRALRVRGVATVILKRGAAGVTVVTNGPTGDEAIAEVPALLARSIDATGAGDAFAAGYVAAIANGLDPADAAFFGNALGALAVETEGAQLAHADLDAVAGAIVPRLPPAEAASFARVIAALRRSHRPAPAET